MENEREDEYNYSFSDKHLRALTEENKRMYKDNRILVAHKAKNCECHKCERHVYKLPPKETEEEWWTSLRFEERAAKRAKREAKREVKKGKQGSITSFFQKKT